MKNQFEIEISPNKYGSEWRNVWNKNNFSGWDDAAGWLQERYSARAKRVADGFVLVFNDRDTQSQFVLEWF